MDGFTFFSLSFLKQVSPPSSWAMLVYTDETSIVTINHTVYTKLQ